MVGFESFFFLCIFVVVVVDVIFPGAAEFWGSLAVYDFSSGESAYHWIWD